MRLGALLQCGPHLLDLGLVQLGWATGGRAPPQGMSAALLPHPFPPQHALVTDLQHSCDLGIERP
ncbi:predicted protein [Streptomyces viridosporus ATCC 14672]|uniref:Predicted protein n=1 Tax=Streptomyces viridosporus (strain ATCC 14672 / DSM 40746 / JCM 4963 / KCTC 9882 / NRRL B-12104 / FH 1290) TaxID=566461 RepID=D6A729_STRV1|nr:predicted protein [Streptomyces viridosporus ATCC 14672]